MKAFLQTVLLVVGIIATTAKECTDPCFCARSETLQCDGRDLTHPPDGYWPGINIANLTNNKIAELNKHSFRGFPMVEALDLEYNKLEELDLEVFAPLTFLRFLNVSNNMIRTVSASPGVRIESLIAILLTDNMLTSLDPDVFLAAPNLEHLLLIMNPILVPSGRPVINHPSIKYLWMSAASFGALDQRTFSGLPKLYYVALYWCGITNITGAFINNFDLNYIWLQFNNITEIKEGTFAKNGQLLLLDLEKNPLSLLDASAVNDVMATTGHIIIDSSPLACGCGYVSLDWWAKSKGVSISARCNDDPNWCTFTNKPNEEL